MELNTIHEADEQEGYIAEQTLQLRIKNISLAFLGRVIRLTLFALWRVRRHTVIVKYKNKILAKLINEELAGKVESKQLLIDEDAEDPIAAPLGLEPKVGLPEKDDLSLDEVVESREEGGENKKILKGLNRIVVQDQLYLFPELPREDLAQVVHLNSTRFVQVIKKDTGTNFNGYINELCINCAVQLLKQHPSYTIRAIADEAGFNSTPILYSVFKKKTSMAPYKSRKTQEPLG